MSAPPPPGSSSTSTAQFFSQVDVANSLNVAGVLSGPTIVRIDTEKTQVLTSLNQQITDFQNEQTATQQARDALTQALDDAKADTTASISALTQQVDDNKADIEGKLAVETNARLSLEQAGNNRATYVDGEIARLDQQHADDDARLTAVETAQSQVNTDIEQKIQERIDAHNADLDNTLPRLAKLEEYFVIDESSGTPIVRIKAGVQFEVSGNFVQGQ